jgi:hypothetical protein
MRNILFSILLSAIAIPLSAEPPFPYIRMLLPIYLEQPVPGAFGSLWQTQFAIHNASARSYTIEWCPEDGCQLDLRADEDLEPNETQTALPARYPKPASGAAGTVVYLFSNPRPQDPNDVSFQLRVSDLSRSATSAGTEIPIVRETSFKTEAFDILGVPVDPRFRLVFRLFEMNLDRARFTVRVFDQATNALISATLLTTSTPPQTLFRFQPGFAEMAIPDVTAGTVRLEIEPLTKGAASWAYVSVTNNESQQVTLVTPQ